MNEKELIAKAKSGDKGAYEGLVILHQHRIYAYCWQRLFYDGTEALDASQITFVKAYSGLKYFREDSSFITWLTSIARNVCWDLRENNKRKFEVPLMPESSHVNIDFEPGLETQYINRDLVKKCLGRLNEKRQEIVFLIYFQGLKYREVAESMGLKTGTLKSNLKRALIELKKCITALSDA